jgi:hypothetical protein
MTSTKTRQHVILPDSGKDLLRQELALAFAQLGFNVIRTCPDALRNPGHHHYLPRLLELNPLLFFSVNLQGLLGQSETANLLLSAGIPVLAWFVDNPWHILSGMRGPEWKNFYLAVSDHSFIQTLRLAGGKHVLHLPLAASPEHMRSESHSDPAPSSLGELVFVGRTAFPGRDGFFAGQSLPEDSLDKARLCLKKGFGQEEERPDFQWWVREFELSPLHEAFWPGKKARRPGLGAAQCNVWWRAHCLKEAQAGKNSLTLFGDASWRDELNGAAGDLRPPLDYYAALPHLYRKADFSLNLNSLLLPAGLSQRIFDVWTAGGFCLTDWSAGLQIFPRELTEEICFRSLEELPDLLVRFKADPLRKEKIRKAWRAHILSEHTYLRRLRTLLEKPPLCPLSGA